MASGIGCDEVRDAAFALLGDLRRGCDDPLTGCILDLLIRDRVNSPDDVVGVLDDGSQIIVTQFPADMCISRYADGQLTDLWTWKEGHVQAGEPSELRHNDALIARGDPAAAALMALASAAAWHAAWGASGKLMGSVMLTDSDFKPLRSEPR
jgi:hypothetical protein